MRITLLLLALFAPFSVPGQILYTPSSASTRLYFPQLADGGTPSQKWATTIVLVNPSNTAASVSLSFYAENGQPLPLDFGQGSKATLTASLSPGGSASYTSSASSSDIVVGWALATSNVPVLGTVLYQASQDGTPIWDVSATGTGSTYFYESYANYNLGIALVNPSTTQTIHLLLTANDQSGTSSGTMAITLAPNAHTSFVLGGRISGLAARFAGSIAITPTDNPPAPFVAWTMNGRNGLVSSLPQGEMQSPPQYDRRVFDALARVKAAAIPLVQEIAQNPGNFTEVTPGQVLQFWAQMNVVVDSGSTIKATYQSSDMTIHISKVALETLGSNDAALAFLIVRTAVAGFVAVYGVTPGLGISGAGAETAAGLWAVFTLMKAGYDPGGGADCLARIWAAYSAHVPVDSALVSAFNIPNGTGSLIQNLGSFAPGGCSAIGTYGLTQDCNASHNLWHPDFPSQVP
jgi:hypothetical protein